MDWKYYSARQLRDAMEDGSFSGIGPKERAPGCKDCLAYRAATGRGIGGFRNAALNIPESLHFFVGPAACGRHGNFLLPDERTGRFYRIELRESELINGTGPEKVERLICEFLDSAERKPRVITLCLTCSDALLNTDYSRIGRTLMERYGIRFATFIMAPILLESLHTHYERAVTTQFSLLQPEPGKMKSKAVNLLGSNTLCSQESELYRLLAEHGYEVRQIKACRSLEEYDSMGESCLNLVMIKNALPAAKQMQKKWGIPYVTFYECCNPDEIRDNYRNLEDALGVSFPVDEEWMAVKERAKKLGEKYSDRVFALGGTFDFDPVKAAADLNELGLPLKKLFLKKISEKDLPNLKRIEENCGEMEIYLGSEPEMLLFSYQPSRIDLAIGMNPAYFAGSTDYVSLGKREEPFDFYGLNRFLDDVEQAMEQRKQTTAALSAKDPYVRSWSVYRKGV